MNSVVITGYIKTKTELKKSAKGTTYLKNILLVGNDKNDIIDYIPIVAFGERAITIDKASAGVTMEIKGKLRSEWDKERKKGGLYIVVEDVQLTNDIQNEEAFMDNVEPFDSNNDDLPF